MYLNCYMLFLMLNENVYKFNAKSSLESADE
jgi:hypothetical protein